MLAELTNYQIFEKICESSNSQVYRGRHEQDNLPVIIKFLKTEFLTSQAIARYKLEYEITKSLNSDFVINVYDFKCHQNQFAIVLEDFGGESLTRFFAANKPALPEVLDLAIQICESVVQIHAANIIHKDINPSNLVFNPETKQLKVIDFGIASDLLKENLIANHNEILEGTLAYISPEQTGRMNRSLDYRTDIYSMGATFYQMLTGTLPFTSDEPLELIHHHLALEPIALHLVNPEIPPILSDIILKLLAKNAEDRYQSAWGVKADLEECLRQWQINQQIEHFDLATQDIADKFLISEKLYGRSVEVERLLATFNQVANPHDNQEDRVKTILISGYSGIGKSRIVQEVQKMIAKSRGCFISGKFEQYRRNLPYLGIIKAFQGLIRQLLTESEESLDKWRSQLIAALGNNSHVITQVIPTLSLVIGKQSDDLILENISDNQNRFNIVFQKFIKVFAQLEHPLVIFLDDLQWADRASLKLLELLATSPQQKSLLLIGTYRDNEVTAVHPMMQILKNIQQKNGEISQLYLTELELTDINQLIADTLHCSETDARPLAELIQQKTGGNPFFMNEFLKSLYAEQLISFDYDLCRWQWSIAEIGERNITDNVVSLMAGKIQKLGDRTQELLQIAACIGNQFDLDILTLACEASPKNIAYSLEQAIVGGLILPMSNAHKVLKMGVTITEVYSAVAYRFVHDQIQQATYSLLSSEQKSLLHHKIGCLLSSKLTISEKSPNSLEHHSEQNGEQIFAVTSQLNLGIEQIVSTQEFDRLVCLNLLAAKKARSTYAYESAAEYAEMGLQILTDDLWQRQPNIAMDLHLEAANAASLIGKFDRVDQLVLIIFDHATDVLERIKAVAIQIQSMIARNELSTAIAIAIESLDCLGIDIPKQPNPETVAAAFDQIRQQLAITKNVSGLAPMTDPYKLAAMNVLANMASAAYIGSPKLYPLIVLKQIELSLAYGNTSQTAYAFSTYGLILCINGEITCGNHSADVALALLDKFQALNFKAKIYNLVYHFVRPWQEPLRNVIASLLEGYQSGLESGDLEFAAYCVFNYCQLIYFAGENLQEVNQAMQIYGEAIAQLNQNTALSFHQIGQQSALNWLNDTENPQNLVGVVYNINERLSQHQAAGDQYSIATANAHQLMLAYHFGQPQEAIAIARQTEQTNSALGGTFLLSLSHFYHALALLANQDQSIEQVTITVAEIAQDLSKLKHWASHAPQNFAHKYELVRAEQARVMGNPKEASDLYDRAIALAKEHGYIQEEALANELTAKFYLSLGKTFIAKAYMTEARFCYLQWGSTTKVQYLENYYSQLLDLVFTTKSSFNSISTLSSSNSLQTLDLEAVIKVYQAIASEIQLDQLLTTLMNILIENAGAQTGYLLLPSDLSSFPRQNQWRIEAVKTIAHEQVIAMQSIPIDTISADGNFYVPISLIHYVARTQESVVLNNATQVGDFQNDPWIVQHQSKSLLCMPLINQGDMTAIVLLENNLVTDAFTPERITILNLLSNQAAISIVKSRLLQQQEELNQSLQAEICDRQLAEKERDRVIAIIQASTDIIGMSSPQGKVIWNNRQANKVQGRASDVDVSQLTIPSYHPQWAIEIIQSQGIPSAVEHGTWIGETALLTYEGIEVPISQMIIAHKDANGELEYISTIMRDISEAKVREAALKLSEITLQNLVAGTAMVTGDDFFPALVKHIAEALHVKYALVTELVGDQLHALAFWAHGAIQPPMIYFPAHTPCEIALSNGEFICESFVQQLFPDDADLVTMQAESYMGIALKDADGNPIGNLCVLDTQPLQDTKRIGNILQVFAARASAELQRKAANEALYELNQSLESRVKQRTTQLESANKELESFSYSVSHDLRAPLRAIDGFSRILQEDYSDRLEGEGDRYLKIVRDNTKRMGELIDDLLNLSRWNRKELLRRPILMNNFIQQTLAGFQSEINDRQIQLLVADLPDCEADNSLLTQVWINLISNALKYTGKTENVCIEIGCQLIDDQETYFIRDNGAGFDMQYADKLFGVFQRMHLERDFEGTGIGLAIVQRIIQRHGGKIWAEAAIDQGATFYFTIPQI